MTLLEAVNAIKTYALGIFLRLVAEEGVEVGKILTVTFTTAATEELRERIRDLLVEARNSPGRSQAGEDPAFLGLRNEEVKVSKEECIRRIKLAITCFDEAIISTIHGFCGKGAFGNALETESLFEAELDRESDKMTMEGVREYWRERFLAPPVGLPPLPLKSSNPRIWPSSSTSCLPPRSTSLVLRKRAPAIWFGPHCWRLLIPWSRHGTRARRNTRVS